ncbi:MAG TPA: LpqB family beta-propeller domain-containing protein, partial [Streptomyces sp.]
MRAMGGRGRRHLRTWPVPVCAVLLLAGCASMPSSGEVRKVGEGDGQRADAGSQMRVFGIPPHSGESASEIVSGFMEATTSGEADFATAKKYLTRALSQRWNPFAGITVLSGAGRPSDDLGTDRKEGYTTVTLTGTKTAVVDGKHAYSPEQGNFQTSIHLVRQNNEWRIDELQNGLVLSEQDFQRIYHSVNMYYFADLGSDVQRTGGVQKTLVADPVYLRNQLQDPLVSTVSTLLGGPTDWLSPVVTSAVPAGVRLSDKDSDHGVSIDDSQHLKVRLDAHANQFGGPRCTDFAAQLYATVQAQASAKLAAVDVLRADGSTACSLGNTQAQTYGPENLVGSSTRQYYIDADQHRLRELGGETTKAEPVSGPFGANKANLDSVAVRRDEQMAAGVRSNGRQLVVSSLIGDDQFHAPVATSAVKDGLSAPSWDGFGDLWVADRN